MTILRFITVYAPVSLVAATAGFSQHVQTDFDHQVNFAQYKTHSAMKSSLAVLCGIRA